MINSVLLKHYLPNLAVLVFGISIFIGIPLYFTPLSGFWVNTTLWGAGLSVTVLLSGAITSILQGDLD